MTIIACLASHQQGQPIKPNVLRSVWVHGHALVLASFPACSFAGSFRLWHRGPGQYPGAKPVDEAGVTKQKDVESVDRMIDIIRECGAAGDERKTAIEQNAIKPARHAQRSASVRASSTANVPRLLRNGLRHCLLLLKTIGKSSDAAVHRTGSDAEMEVRVKMSRGQASGSFMYFFPSCRSSPSCCR
ncbi:hypothetical protein [Noviherbaspirillum sp.]|uniref:hypothetical protein n=1 Tax=Noviherbaspirillum sp. TaxID=1926288 RepID=UPI002FE1C0E2